MTFYNEILQRESVDFSKAFSSVTPGDVERSLEKRRLEPADLLNLLSPAAERYLEVMARKANMVKRQHFGQTIGVYAPLYISDYCSNYCTYCGFNCTANFERTKLTLEEIEEEAKALYDFGIRHVLMLTGEAPSVTPLSYLKEAIELLQTYFSSVALEIFPMDEDDYRVLKEAGADSLTIYQEVYNRKIYSEVHPKGRKSDYKYRLETPDRAARAGLRGLNIGALFGLGDIRSEAYFSALHARYLEREYPDIEISLSLPRITKAEGIIAPKNVLPDLNFVQFMLAWRLFIPRLGITISTRERAEFRDKLIHLGATRYSAGSRTDVGGYSKKKNDPTVQFEITDTRSVSEVSDMIRNSGYQPVFKDWEFI